MKHECEDWRWGCEHGAKLRFSSVQFSCSVMSNSLRPHEVQPSRPPCPSPTPGVHPNRQIWPWNIELSRAQANKVFPREHTGHSKHPLPTKREDSTHGHYQMINTKIKLIILLQPKMEKFYTVTKTRPGPDCGSDHDLLIAKFRLKLKKVGTNTRPCMYDLIKSLTIIQCK